MPEHVHPHSRKTDFLFPPDSTKFLHQFSRDPAQARTESTQTLFLNIQIVLPFCAVALGLCCYAQAFSSCSELGLLVFAIRRLLSAVAEHRL